MAILRVSNQAQLASAVNNARSGDTISLSSGTYDGFVTNKLNFNQKVTITSADPRNPAVINEFLLRGANNVEFKDLKFDYNPAKSKDAPFWIEGSNNVNFVNVDIEGHMKGGYGDGVGLRIKNSQNVVVRDSEISDFRNGLYSTKSTNVDIINNDMRGMSNDSMLFAAMTDVLISGNDFRNMKSPPALKHKDSIQFLTSPTEPGSKDIVIRGNVIENREFTHGIYFTNPMFNNGDKNAVYQNILIEDNLIRSNHVHGITMNNGNGVTIRDNVVEKISEGNNTPPINVPLINVSTSSKNVIIQGNDVASVPKPQNSSWVVSGNDVSGKNYMHWYSDGGIEANRAAGKVNVQSSATAVTEAAKASGGAVAPAVADGGDTIRIDARNLDEGATRFLVKDIDFDDGDVIVFSKFAADTFYGKAGGNALDIWDDRGSVKIDSAIDLAELAAQSSDIAAVVKGDDLIVEIDNGPGGTVEFVLAGFGDEFRAAADPELF